MDIQAFYYPTDVKKLAADKYNSVVIPYQSKEPDGAHRFALDFTQNGDYLWAESIEGSEGIRVPVHRIRPQDKAGVVALLAAIWQAREEFSQMHPQYKYTQELHVVFDPADTAGDRLNGTDFIHFGMYVVMR